MWRTRLRIFTRMDGENGPRSLKDYKKNDLMMEALS